MNLYIFIIGLVIGSFLNVCIYRIPEGKSIINPPSSCGNCRTRLRYIDMIPVLNYVINFGRCRYCGAKYSLQYPAVELLNGFLYLSIAIKYGINYLTVLYSLITSLLIVISFIDYKYKIIPDRLIIFGFICTVLFNIIININIYDKLLGMFIGFGIFMLIAVLTNAMGGGDIKLMALLGLLFGVEGVLFTTVIAFIYGAVISIILLILKIKNRKDEISFGPFISLSALTYILLGKTIISFYCNLLNIA